MEKLAILPAKVKGHSSETMRGTEFHPAFIPGWLDDAGLTPAQFRVFCHLARRGTCYESLNSISGCCHMRRRTIQDALADLRERKAITKEERTGRPCVYRLAPRPKQALGGGVTQPKTGTKTQPKRGTTYLDRNRHYKGSPFKGNPSKVAPTSSRIPPEDL